MFFKSLLDLFSFLLKHGLSLLMNALFFILSSSCGSYLLVEFFEAGFAGGVRVVVAFGALALLIFFTSGEVDIVSSSAIIEVFLMLELLRE